MSAIDKSFTPDPLTTLVESGAIELTQARASVVYVRRGMTIRTCEGCAAGHVAALLVDGRSEKVTHLVLSRPCQLLEYRLVSLPQIAAVDDGEVRLHFFHSVLEGLPIWHIA